MAGLVADTHAAVRYLLSSRHLSARAASRIRGAIEAGTPVYVSAVTVVEVVYLVEKGRLPQAALERLLGELTREDGGSLWRRSTSPWRERCRESLGAMCPTCPTVSSPRQP